MVGLWFALGLVAAGAPASSEASSATRSSIPHVLVSLDARAVSAAVEVAEVIREIRAVWTSYADLVFANTAEATEAHYDDRVSVVIVESRQPGPENASALGWIAFPSPGRPANTATVSLGAARSLTAHGHWMGRAMDQVPPAWQRKLLTRAVGRSAAHEIGHYLLRSNAHAASGLMRRRLPVEDLISDDLGAFRLEPRDVEALRRRVAFTGGMLADIDPRPDRSE